MQDDSQKKKNGTLTAKRKYTKRKNIEESPSTSKNKLKKPLGRPPKPKELTEIEKDLLIIKSATTVSSNESSRRQSVEVKQEPLKKVNSNSAEVVIILNGEPSAVLKKELDNSTKDVITSNDMEPRKEETSKLDTNPMEEVLNSNVKASSKELQKKLDFNTIEEMTLSSTEPSKGPNKPVNRKLDSKSTNEIQISNGTKPRKGLKRKLFSLSTEEVSLTSTEPSVKRQKCDEEIEVGD